jgi:hypothetical protein
MGPPFYIDSVFGTYILLRKFSLAYNYDYAVKNHIFWVGFQVFMVVSVKMNVFWIVGEGSHHHVVSL